MRPPKCVLHQLEQLMARFFWRSNDEDLKAHWISWKHICLPTAEGSLGIRRLVNIYDAFSLKLWWRFHSQNSLWACFTLMKYYEDLFPGRMLVSPHDSRIWHRLWTEDRLHSLCAFYDLPAEFEYSLRSAPILWGERDVPRWNLTPHSEFSLTSAWECIRHRAPRRTLLADFWSDYVYVVRSPVLSRFLISFSRGNLYMRFGCTFLHGYSASSPAHAQWKAPASPVGRLLFPEPWMKLNSDGLFDSSQQAAAGGGLLRDHRSELITSYYLPLQANSSFEMEFRSLLQGLLLLLQTASHVWIELDAAAVVTVITSDARGSGQLREVLSRLRLILRDLHVRVRHIHR
ncbi:hypothetical protein C2S52_021995 [Perilla frutescens var. hirtella]|nr:hypothetical protein C2S52_021995 [Perilla frutescens var. hirtella]